MNSIIWHTEYFDCHGYTFYEYSLKVLLCHFGSILLNVPQLPSLSRLLKSLQHPFGPNPKCAIKCGGVWWLI